jgi:hypothetical protein
VVWLLRQRPEAPDISITDAAPRFITHIGRFHAATPGTNEAKLLKRPALEYLTQTLDGYREVHGRQGATKRGLAITRCG